MIAEWEPVVLELKSHKDTGESCLLAIGELPVFVIFSNSLISYLSGRHQRLVNSPCYPLAWMGRYHAMQASSLVWFYTLT